MTLFGFTGANGGGMFTMILLYGLIIAVFYFILIRPQSKQKKKEEEMRNSIDVGDTIVTIGGIVGKVVSVKDEDIVIETGADRNETKRNAPKTEEKKDGEKKGFFSFLKK